MGEAGSGPEMQPGPLHGGLWGCCLELERARGEAGFPACDACLPGVLRSRHDAKQGIFSLWLLPWYSLLPDLSEGGMLRRFLGRGGMEGWEAVGLQ